MQGAEFWTRLLSFYVKELDETHVVPEVEKQ